MTREEARKILQEQIDKYTLVYAEGIAALKHVIKDLEQQPCKEQESYVATGILSDDELKHLEEQMKKSRVQLISVEQEPCEMTAEEYHQRMIQAFQNTNTDELIAVCVLPKEENFKHLEWLLKSHYKKESCADVISRQEAIKIIEKYADEYESRANRIDTDNPAYPAYHAKKKWNGIALGLDKAKEILKELSPVTPSQIVGRWIPIEYDGYADGSPVWDKWERSKCRWEHSGDEESLTAFCPNCGAKMQKVIKE